MLADIGHCDILVWRATQTFLFRGGDKLHSTVAAGHPARVINTREVFSGTTVIECPTAGTRWYIQGNGVLRFEDSARFADECLTNLLLVTQGTWNFTSAYIEYVGCGNETWNLPPVEYDGARMLMVIGSENMVWSKGVSTVSSHAPVAYVGGMFTYGGLARIPGDDVVFNMTEMISTYVVDGRQPDTVAAYLGIRIPSRGFGFFVDNTTRIFLNFPVGAPGLMEQIFARGDSVQVYDFVQGTIGYPERHELYLPCTDEWVSFASSRNHSCTHQGLFMVTDVFSAMHSKVCSVMPLTRILTNHPQAWSFVYNLFQESRSGRANFPRRHCSPTRGWRRTDVQVGL